jgi:hypothetical protein
MNRIFMICALILSSVLAGAQSADSVRYVLVGESSKISVEIDLSNFELKDWQTIKTDSDLEARFPNAGSVVVTVQNNSDEDLEMNPLVDTYDIAFGDTMYSFKNYSNIESINTDYPNVILSGRKAVYHVFLPREFVARVSMSLITLKEVILSKIPTVKTGEDLENLLGKSIVGRVTIGMFASKHKVALSLTVK